MSSLKKSFLALFLGVTSLAFCASTALRDAVAKRDTHKVRELLAAGGVNLTQRDAQYKTEVDYAREKGAVPEIMVLLEAEQYRQLAASASDPHLKQMYEDRARGVRQEAVMAERELR
jgi:hypothetical protein